MIGNHVDGYKLSQGFKSLTLRLFYIGPLVKWLRHRPFTAVTRVRIPYGSCIGSDGCITSIFYPSKSKRFTNDFLYCCAFKGFEKNQPEIEYEALMILNLTLGKS